MNNDLDKLYQIKTNAFVAEYIYSHKLKIINRISLTVTILTIITPIIIIYSQLVAKGTTYENTVNFISLFTSCILFCLTILSLILRHDQKKENFLQGRRDNIYISNEVDSFESDLTLDRTWFYKFVVEQDKRDRDNISDTKKTIQQEAYRYSLKKLIPGNSKVVCSSCGKSPFKFTKGDCDACGNKTE